MPSNNLSIGKDLSFTLVTSRGTLDISNVTDYAIKPKTTNLTHKGQNGETTHGVIPDGYEISIKLDRADSTLDDFFVQAEADYFAGINTPGGTIYETVRNLDGSISQYRYTNVVLVYEDGGSYKGDSYVNQSINCMASRKIKVQ